MTLDSVKQSLFNKRNTCTPQCACAALLRAGEEGKKTQEGGKKKIKNALKKKWNACLCVSCGFFPSPKKCFNLHLFQLRECQVDKAILVFKETICPLLPSAQKKHLAAICQLHS